MIKAFKKELPDYNVIKVIDLETGDYSSRSARETPCTSWKMLALSEASFSDEPDKTSQRWPCCGPFLLRVVPSRRGLVRRDHQAVVLHP
jgi:hypothetical protein